MRRTPVPTPRLLRLAAAVLALAMLVPILPVLGPAWLAALGALVLAITADFTSRPRRDDVELRREIAPLYHVGRRGSYRIRLRNTSPAPLSVSLREVLPPELEGDILSLHQSVAPGGELDAEVTFTPLRRGSHRIPPMGLGLSWGLRLLEYRDRYVLDDEIAAAPGRPAGEIAHLLANATVLDDIGAHRTRRPQADWEFESLREYVVGDELRRLDWKASARRHRPMVRQFQQERDAEVILALDCGRLMGTLINGVTKLDLAMTPLLDLAAVALRRQDRVGLLAFDSRPRVYLPPRSGLRQLYAMTDALARLPETDDPTSHVQAVAHLENRHRKRALLIVFTDFTDELSARDMYASLGALARRHNMIFVAVSDPHLAEVFDTPVTDERGLFERSIAGRLLVERRRTLERVERLGVVTLDEEPRRLSGPLIGRYVDMRLSRAL